MICFSRIVKYKYQVHLIACLRICMFFIYKHGMSSSMIICFCKKSRYLAKSKRVNGASFVLQSIQHILNTDYIVATSFTMQFVCETNSFLQLEQVHTFLLLVLMFLLVYVNRSCVRYCEKGRSFIINKEFNSRYL